MLDTGFSGIALNGQYVKGAEYSKTILHTLGDTKSLGMTVVHLRIGGYLVKNREAWIMDLSLLEKEKGIPLLGLLGAGFLRKFEVLIDFVEKELTFYPLKKEAPPEFKHLDEPLASLELKMNGSLPVLKAHFGSLDMWLVFDTGAEITLMDEKHRELLMPYLVHHNEWIKLLGFEMAEKSMRVFQLDVPCGEKYYRPSFRMAFHPMGPFNQEAPGRKIGGILSYHALDCDQMAISLKKRRILLWKNGEDEVNPLLMSKAKEPESGSNDQ